MSEAARLPAAGSGNIEALPTVLGRGCSFDGLLSFRGAARVDGFLTGEILAEGRLVVGPEARLKARIVVDELILAGEIEGDVEARERVQLEPTARLDGSLRSPRLSMREGAWLRGRCETGQKTGPVARESRSAG